MGTLHFSHPVTKMKRPHCHLLKNNSSVARAILVTENSHFEGSGYVYQVSVRVFKSTQSPCFPRYSYSMWQEYMEGTVLTIS